MCRCMALLLPSYRLRAAYRAALVTRQRCKDLYTRNTFTTMLTVWAALRLYTRSSVVTHAGVQKVYASSAIQHTGVAKELQRVTESLVPCTNTHPRLLHYTGCHHTTGHGRRPIRVCCVRVKSPLSPVFKHMHEFIGGLW